MKVKVMCAMAALAGAGIAAPVAAQQMPGPYVRLGAGFGLTQSLSAQLNTNFGELSQRVPVKALRFAIGPAVAAGGGYQFANGMRIDLEGGYRSNAISGASGSESKVSGFASALYDADVGLDWLYPFAGIGVGVQSTTLHNVGVQGAEGATVSTNGGTGSQFAYRAVLGAGVPLPWVPNLSVTAEYHYTRTAGGRSYWGNTTGAAPTPSRLHVGDDASHEVIVGLRYGFGEPTTAAPPEETFTAPLAGALAPPARSYVVYFDANSAALSERARDVIAQAARASSRLAYTRIEISGHTDVTGAKASNIELSRLRAQAVADELVRWGIARSVIEIHAFGDEKPAFIAPPGLSEPRNRRVEILYR